MMLRRTLTIALILCVTLVFGFVVADDVPEARNDATYACILFDQTKNQPLFTGHIAHAEFRKWFLDGYDVGGERVETPRSATVFGTLVVTDGETIVALPLATWGRWNTAYTCQSIALGDPPMFSVYKESKSEFIDAIRSRLQRLSKSEAEQ